MLRKTDKSGTNTGKVRPVNTQKSNETQVNRVIQWKKELRKQRQNTTRNTSLELNKKNKKKKRTQGTEIKPDTINIS